MLTRHPSAVLFFSMVLLAIGASASGASKGAPRRDEIAVHRLLMAHDVVEGEPVWADVPFIDDGEPIYAFIEASSCAATPRRLTITVGQGGRAARTLAVTLPPGARRHRTWAMLPSGVPSGQWTATVRTADGVVLEEVEFEVED